MESPMALYLTKDEQDLLEVALTAFGAGSNDSRLDACVALRKRVTSDEVLVPERTTTWTECKTHGYRLNAAGTGFDLHTPQGDPAGWAGDHVQAARLCQALDLLLAQETTSPATPPVTRLERRGFVEFLCDATVIWRGESGIEETRHHYFRGDRIAVAEATPTYQLVRSGRNGEVHIDTVRLLETPPDENGQA